MEKQLILSFSKNDPEKFALFLKKYKSYKVIDLFDDLFLQYNLVKTPSYYFDYKSKPKEVEEKINKTINKNQTFSLGSWVVLPEENKIYHLIKPLEYLDLRTIRNRNLITYEEQRKLYSKKIAVVGLSVGSQVLITMIRTGIGNDITIIDGDKVELHNLNRTNFFLSDLGRRKVKVINDQIHEIDPYIKISLVDQYLDLKNMDALLKGVDLIIDSFDNFLIKIELRKYAKEHHIPVISGFDLSKGTVVITERYDLNKDIPISFYLNGYSEDDILSLDKKSVKEKTKIFINIIGKKYHDRKMLASVMDVGKKLTGYPQLAIAASLTGSVWTLAAIDILLKKRIYSKKVYINLQELIEKG